MSDETWQGTKVTKGGVQFAVWSPGARSVELEFVNDDGPWYVPLAREDNGIWAVEVPGVGVGARYKYRVDEGNPCPDPRSRFQPDGVHGPSEVVDPDAFIWTDQAWSGLHPENQVFYEVHVGTYTEEGTFAALERELAELKRLGVTAIELMPIAQAPGARNWGYDGVDLFAPSCVYGRPDDLRSLVDTAHRIGLGVILDVVYNHLGPEGNYLRVFSSQYFNPEQQTAWGDALNWEGDGSEFVRQFVIDNAIAWISEYHMDGLRLDATHAITETQKPTVISEIGQGARDAAEEMGRTIVLVAEDGTHEISRARPVAEDGDGLDAVWADDFHHEIRVALTNAHENYYAWYEGTTTGIVRAINKGLELGDRHFRASPIQDRDPASAFVFCIQNHDQVGNRPYGDRINHEINADRYAVASTILLTSPETPLIFMGQEFAASTPFLYFTDHPAELGKLVTTGRRKEFSGFRAFHDAYLRETIPDPQAESTFLASRLDLGERSLNHGIYDLYRELLRLRQEDPVLSHNDRQHTRAIALSAQVIAIHRWWGTQHRLIVANLGHTVDLALPDIKSLLNLRSRPWTLLFSTADPRFSTNAATPTIAGIGGHRRIHLPARTAAIWGIAG